MRKLSIYWKIHRCSWYYCFIHQSMLSSAHFALLGPLLAFYNYCICFLMLSFWENPTIKMIAIFIRKLITEKKMTALWSPFCQSFISSEFQWGIQYTIQRKSTNQVTINRIKSFIFSSYIETIKQSIVLKGK